MADGTIKIAIEVDGKQVNIAAKDLKDLEGAGRESGKGVKEAEDGLKGVGNESSRAGVNIKKFATALGLVAIGAAAFKVLRASMDDAISRFDTLNKFPKVLQALGVSAEDSEKAMKKLSDGIDGLPTKLDDIASTAQRMYTSFGDMDKATDSALALNNALLGSGSSAADAQRGTEQYIKALQTGKIDMDTWNTLSETMDVGLIKIAEGFGFAGKTAKDDLYAALKDGSITMEEFNDKLIEVGTGTGIMAKLAKENSLGLATSLENLKTAAARGIADIIDSFNKLSVEITGKELAQHIDSLKVIVNASFKAIGAAIESTAPIIKAFAAGIQIAINVVKILSPAIVGLMAAYAAHTAITNATAAIQASNKVLAIAQASQKALTVATQTQMATMVATTTAKKADTVATAAQNGVVSASTLAVGLLTGQIKLSTVAMIAKTAATNALGTAMKALSGPIGWVTLGIGALVTATIAVVSWLKKSSEEANRLNAETEKLEESTNTLNDSVKQSSDAYKEQQADIQATAKANQDLAAKVEELAAKENKSAAEKQLLNDYINQLNESVSGLNLSYNEEANALSMSSEEMKARIDLMAEQASYNDALERQVEISKEQNEVELQLAEINKLREEWNQKLEEGTVKAGEHKEAMSELDEQEKALTETKAQLSKQQKETEGQITASMEAITEATKNGVTAQMVAFEDLSESQQATVESMKSTWEDYKDAATDMFDTLSDKAELSVSEMTKNLEENQRIIGEWAEGIATLAERGVDEGLLETLRAAGPESAGHVNALVNASDAELAHLSEVFANGGDVATKALAKSLGIEESGVMEAVGHLVSGAEQSLKEEIESANFPTIGESIPKGTAEGIEKGTPEAEKASKSMADKTTKAAKDAFQTQSPSKVFKGIGIDLTDGLALGINQGSSKVTQAIQKMFKGVESNSRTSFGNITKMYDNAISNLDKSLSRLPVVTQKAMSNTTSRLKSGAAEQTNAMKGLSQSYEKEIRQTETSLNELPKIAQKAMSETVGRLRDGAVQQVAVMTKLSADLKTPFKNLNSEFNSIGQNAMKGLNAGLKAGKGQVMATAKRIADDVAAEMRKALKTRSPSKVTKKIGEDTGQGLSDGLRNKQETVEKTSEKMAKAVAEIIENLHRDVTGETMKHNEEIAKIERRAKEDIQLIHAKAATAKRGLTQAEQIRIQRIIEDSNKKIVDIEEKAAKEREKIAKESSKALLDAAKKYVDERKFYGKMSLKDEEEFWRQMMRATEYGTEEWEEAYRNRAKVAAQARSEMEKANDEHTKRIVEIDKKLVEETRKLTDEYKQAYDKRVNTLTNFAGLFDAFAEGRAVSGQKLIQNMQSQVTALEEFSAVMDSLGDRIDNKALIGELEALGPKSLSELKALNSLSDSELKIFVGLYEERFELARIQAGKELEPLKDDIARQIIELNEAAQKELEIVQNDWSQAIEKIVNGTKKELDYLHWVGRDAIKGLEEGMLIQEPSLMATARRIAENVTATIKSAFEISSPSRVMRDKIGKMIPAGIALGIRDYAHLAEREMSKLAGGLIVATPEQALGVSRMKYAGMGSGNQNTSTITNNNTRSFSPTIQNYFTKDISTPSEVARKNRQQQQRLAMEWGY